MHLFTWLGILRTFRILQESSMTSYQYSFSTASLFPDEKQFKVFQKKTETRPTGTPTIHSQQWAETIPSLTASYCAHTSNTPPLWGQNTHVWVVVGWGGCYISLYQQQLPLQNLCCRALSKSAVHLGEGGSKQCAAHWGPVTSPRTHACSHSPIGHVKNELFLLICEIWGACGRLQLAAGVLVSTKMCIYGQTDQNVREREREMERNGVCSIYR